MSFDVSLTDFRFMATSATGQNHGRLHAAVTIDEFSIAGTSMFRAGAVATLATTSRRILALQRLRVSRFGEGFVDLLMTSLANLDSDVLGILVRVGWGILRE